MKLLYLSLLALGLLALSGCAATMTPVVNTTNLQKVDFSGNMKSGEDCAYYALGLLGPFGNASVVQAAQAATLSQVEVVDHSAGWYLLWSETCVKVYGYR